MDINFGSGLVNTPTNMTPLILQPGWNFIANPYFFSMCWDSVLTASGLTADILEMPQAFDSDFVAANVLEPWKGYAVRNKAGYPVQLIFPSHLSACASTAVDSGEFDWLYRLNLLSDDGNDDHNYFGVLKANSTEQHLKYDMSKPPLVKNVPEVSFDDNRATDIRLSNEVADEWNLQVNSPANQRVTLNWSEIAPIPVDKTLLLINDRTNEFIDMARTSQYEFYSGDQTITLEVKLLSHEDALTLLTPQKNYLGQNYPNPFNPVTRINYGIIQPGQVSLTIYSVNGQSVKTLVNETQPTGYYTIEWDGTNDHGEAVSSGVYFYRLNCNDHEVDQHRMILLK